ncbi:hypothetical protein [Clostridium perfringens]|uniref:hypothetical protein n=1 Tax=Clostridium perfringens TaxID=1502 RepID=UPI0030D42412
MNKLKKLKSKIKYNFLQIFNVRVFIFSLIVVLLASIVMMNKVNIYKNNVNEYINSWDYIFRVITSPFFVSWILLPIIIFITFNSIKYSNINNNLLVRAKSKRLYILSKYLSLALIIILFLSLLFISLFIISLIESKFKVSLSWSNAINSETDLKILTNFLYVPNFIDYMNPILVMFFVFLQFFLISIIIVLFRDLLFYCFKNTTVAISITLVYLGYNFMYFGDIPYISTANIAVFWFHKFKDDKTITILLGNANNVQTLGCSLIISIMSILILFYLNIRRVKKIDASFI